MSQDCARAKNMLSHQKTSGELIEYHFFFFFCDSKREKGSSLSISPTKLLDVLRVRRQAPLKISTSRPHLSTTMFLYHIVSPRLFPFPPLSFSCVDAAPTPEC